MYYEMYRLLCLSRNFAPLYGIKGPQFGDIYVISFFALLLSFEVFFTLIFVRGITHEILACSVAKA